MGDHADGHEHHDSGDASIAAREHVRGVAAHAHGPRLDRVTIAGGEVAEVDWR